MSEDIKEMAHPDRSPVSDPTKQDLEGMANKWSTDERDRNKKNMAKQLHRRRSLSGWKKTAAVVGIAAAALGGASMLQGSHEKSPDDIRISEINPNNPPAQIFDGKAVIKVVSEQDLPHARTSPATRNNEPNALSWGEISELNGTPVSEAVNSDGQKEVVLDNPLIIGDPDNPGEKWIAAMSNGKPIFFKMGQETVNNIFMQPNDSSGSVFKSISPSDSALDYGKVSIQDAPKTSSK